MLTEREEYLLDLLKRVRPYLYEIDCHSEEELDKFDSLVVEVLEVIGDEEG